MKVSVIIPVYNENDRLKKVLSELNQYDEVIVIDDGSIKPVKSYIEKNIFSNLKIIENDRNYGYIYSIKKGIKYASGDIIVTMDGDGEHKPNDIETLISKIMNKNCDIVFGKRPNIARPSEKVLLNIAKFFTGINIKDAGTGFRAIKAEYAKKLKFYGKCTCGTLLIELSEYNMKICEIDVDLPKIDKPRRMAWEHLFQFFYVIYYGIKFILTKKRKLNEKFV